jgi:hypothetical protein
VRDEVASHECTPRYSAQRASEMQASSCSQTV